MIKVIPAFGEEIEMNEMGSHLADHIASVSPTAQKKPADRNSSRDDVSFLAGRVAPEIMKW